jgi:hypothetical protein
MIRKAAAADLPEIERVMRASMAALSEGFYDARQAASAARYIAEPDGQLVDDGTYFVIEEEGRVVACGGWSRRRKLFTGTNVQANVHGFLDPARDAATQVVLVGSDDRPLTQRWEELRCVDRKVAASVADVGVDDVVCDKLFQFSVVHSVHLHL